MIKPQSENDPTWKLALPGPTAPRIGLRLAGFLFVYGLLFVSFLSLTWATPWAVPVDFWGQAKMQQIVRTNAFFLA